MLSLAVFHIAHDMSISFEWPDLNELGAKVDSLPLHSISVVLG